MGGALVLSTVHNGLLGDFDILRGFAARPAPAAVPDIVPACLSPVVGCASPSALAKRFCTFFPGPDSGLIPFAGLKPRRSKFASRFAALARVGDANDGAGAL